MRSIHVCAYYAPAYAYGGPVHSVHALCRMQQAHGLDVEVFTTNAAGTDRLPSAPQGRAFEGVRVRYFELSTPSRLLGAAALPGALRRAIAGADVVHLHGLFNRTVWDAAAVLQSANKPYVLSPRGMLERPALAHHGWRKRLSWMLKDRRIVEGAAVLHATSSRESETLRRLSGNAEIVVVPNVVTACSAPPGAAARWRRGRNIPDNAPVVLSLGRLHRIKRLDLLASAFLTLRQRVPSVHLVIAGPDEQQLRKSLENSLATARDAVHWAGRVDQDEKSALLEAATVLVQCSDSESFGMSVAEALAAGTPVVVTRTCPWGHIERWGCGFWVEQNASAIAEAIERIVTSPRLAMEQGSAAERFVEHYLTPSRLATAWRNVYQAAARRGRVAA